ncbi:MAG: hypothetical protein ACFFCP_11330 [Promethearchaeota archaeon]
MQKVCDEHRGHGFGCFMGPRFFGMCGPSGHEGMSKETEIKYLEALKSRLEDRIKHIDQKIDEMHKGAGQEA